MPDDDDIAAVWLIPNCAVDGWRVSGGGGILFVALVGEMR